MKKTLLSLFSVFFILSTYAQSNVELKTVEIGEFSSTGKMLKAYALITPDTANIQMYVVEASLAVPTTLYSEYMPTVAILCDSTMTDTFKRISDKYKEWEEIAKANKVGKFQKEMDIESPLLAVSINKGIKDAPKIFEYKNKKFVFNYKNAETAPTIFCNMTVEDKNMIMKMVTGLAFKSPEEFDRFIEFLEPNKVLKRIREGKTSLFN